MLLLVIMLSIACGFRSCGELLVFASTISDACWDFKELNPGVESCSLYIAV